MKVSDDGRNGCNRYVLNDCTYCFENGKHYVLIGSSGEGKSSLLNLVAGIYQNYEGNISVGGGDIRTASCRSSLLPVLKHESQR
mgnify:CR=1 FL=1